MGGPAGRARTRDTAEARCHGRAHAKAQETQRGHGARSVGDATAGVRVAMRRRKWWSVATWLVWPVVGAAVSLLVAALCALVRPAESVVSVGYDSTLGVLWVRYDSAGRSSCVVKPSSYLNDEITRATRPKPDWALRPVAGEWRSTTAVGLPLRSFRRDDEVGKINANLRRFPDPAALAFRPWWPGLLANGAIFAAAFALGSILITRATISRRRSRGCCPHCAYDRRGLPEAATCPECGRIERAGSADVVPGPALQGR